MKKTIRQDASEYKLKESSCVPPQIRIKREDREKIIETKRQSTKWHQTQWDAQISYPEFKAVILNAISRRIENYKLLSQGVDVEPTTDFPQGMMPEGLENYPQIVRAFSRTFGPNLFEELSMVDPFPNGELYWSNFFFQVSPNTVPPLLRVNVSKKDYCFGETGSYQSNGGPMWIYTCASEEDIFHEIGHCVMDDGILKRRKPLYFHYTLGGFTPVGGSAEMLDAIDILNTWYGKKLDRGIDNDGAPIGYVSEYAATNQKEDFAETFMHYVYRPSILWDKIRRQSANGSETLSKKASLISYLYAGMTFNDGGIPAGWPGYQI